MATTKVLYKRNKLGKKVLGPNGRLAEILSAEDQKLTTSVIKRAESMFEFQDPKLSYWWSGLKDEDDDGVWSWENSGIATYTNWHPSAKPQINGYNCMQFLSGTHFDAKWMNFQCTDTYISTRPICQLK